MMEVRRRSRAPRSRGGTPCPRRGAGTEEREGEGAAPPPPPFPPPPPTLLSLLLPCLVPLLLPLLLLLAQQLSATMTTASTRRGSTSGEEHARGRRSSSSPDPAPLLAALLPPPRAAAAPLPLLLRTRRWPKSRRRRRKETSLSSPRTRRRGRLSRQRPTTRRPRGCGGPEFFFCEKRRERERMRMRMRMSKEAKEKKSEKEALCVHASVEKGFFFFGGRRRRKKFESARSHQLWNLERSRDAVHVLVGGLRRGRLVGPHRSVKNAVKGRRRRHRGCRRRRCRQCPEVRRCSHGGRRGPLERAVAARRAPCGVSPLERGVRRGADAGARGDDDRGRRDGSIVVDVGAGRSHLFL